MKKLRQTILIFLLFFLVLCFFPSLISGVSSIPDIRSVVQAPIEPPPNMAVNVVSTVVDRNGLLNVSLFYSVNNSLWISESMTLIDGDNYNGTFLASIPGQTDDAHVSYYVFALDAFGYSTTSELEEYTVTEDDKEPWFVGIWLVQPKLRPITPWDAVKIRVHITDEGYGIANTTLFYGFSEPLGETAQLPFSKIVMTLTDGDKYDGIYEGTIPAQQNNTIVWYYIETYDFVGNKRISDYSAYEVFFSDKSYLQVIVQIAEIDTEDLEATLNVIFFARLPSPYEQESFWVHAYNAKRDESGANIDYFRINSSTGDRFFYQGTVTWRLNLLGISNSYPFDSYYLNLTFVVWWSKIDDMRVNSAYYDDYRLHFVWENLKIVNRGANYTSEYPEVFVNLQITRNTDDALPVILPILALFFMLGATLSVDSKTHLRSRLTVYLTSFVFIIGFFYSIGTLVPLRFGFTVAELMIITLALGTVALVVSSFISASISEHRCQTLIGTCTDMGALLFIFILLWFVFRVRYSQAPILLSIPSEYMIGILVGINHGLAIRMYLKRQPLKMQLMQVCGHKGKVSAQGKEPIEIQEGEMSMSEKRGKVRKKEKLRELIKLVDDDFKIRTYQLLLSFPFVIIILILIFFLVYLVPYFFMVSPLEQVFINLAWLAVGATFLGIVFSSEKLIERSILEKNYKKIGRYVKKERKPLLKALILMKCKEPRFPLSKIYEKYPSLFDEVELLKKLYE